MLTHPTASDTHAAASFGQVQEGECGAAADDAVGLGIVRGVLFGLAAAVPFWAGAAMLALRILR